MVDVTFIDHVTDGLSLLTGQWDDTPVIRGVLAAWLTPLNKTEQCALDVRDGFNINTAVGAQLDIIGAYFDEARLGRTDDEYRDAILSIIAAINGSGTPNQLLNLYASLTNAESAQIWEHYPLSIAILATNSDPVSLNVPSYMLSASVGAVEYVCTMYDPESFCWIGNDTVETLSNLITNEGDQIITNLGDNIVVSYSFEDIDDGALRSSFIDISQDEDVGYGEDWGNTWGGSHLGHSELCECVSVDNSLVTSGGNGFVDWAEVAEFDPTSGTTNKSIPIRQYQDSGIKRKQPLPRQFFNWMMSFIDDWLNFISKRNSSIGTIRMTIDATQTIADYATRFGGTWVLVGTQLWTTSNETTFVFERTA